MPLNVAVVSQHELIQRGVESTLREFGTRVRVVDQGLPDITDVVLWSSFGGIRVDQIEELRKAYGAAHLAVLCWNFEPGLVQSCLDAGATGYLSTALTGEDLIGALEQINDGKVVVSPSPHETETTPVVLPDWPGRDDAGLSEREGDIVALISSGHSNEDIADQLFLSINTVKSYIRSAYRKMGVDSRSQAVLWGVDHGMRGRRPAGSGDDAL